MVNTEKVYLMTKAALFEKKETNGAIHIVSFRRKDYILYHMMLVFLSVTIAYMILVGTVFFMIVMANDTLVLNVAEMVIIIAALVAGYAVLLILYYTVSHKYYGEKHVKARQDIRTYLTVMKALETMEKGDT
ncbi:MAG: hypothetical protein J6Z23_04010 [Lachnospiraceae bacterium]|nr:hypothetical protein [Lachnospiraceae bacterium]MBP5254530.1 hypothetical protein [Lachnospiraceae bacterium]